MLGLSTLSGLSYASSSLSQDVDLNLVEDIIQRAPRSATTFPLVYRAYGEVLEENGLSQSSDTAYYQFLLKLGVIRAPTWGERWDLWKATNTIQSRPQAHLSPKKARRVSTREATIKARVPFLASASSDLDDGFEGDGENVDIRASPRKVLRGDRRKSLVGHSPSQSIDYDFASLTAPIRTSTPVNRGRGSPPLPPYSVSDVSEIVDSETLGDTQGTPRAGPQRLVVEELDADVMREMERRADEFFETGLRGRCWDVWAQASEWVQRTTEQIDTVRSNILLRQTLARWRAVHSLNLTMPNTADAHRQHHLKKVVLEKWIARLKAADLEKREEAFVAKVKKERVTQCWANWRTRLIKNRTQRWTRDMSAREKSFSARREERLASTALETWRDHTSDRIDRTIADLHYSKRTKGQVLRSWRYLAAQKQDLEAIEADYAIRKLASTKSSVLATWRKRLGLVNAEERVLLLKEQNLVGRTWEIWRTATSQRKTALQLFERHSLGRALNRWKATAARVHALDHRAADIRAKSDQVIVRQTFGTWIASERSKLLAQVHDTRLTRDCLQRWQKKRKSLEILETAADGHTRQSATRALHDSLSRWRDRLGHRQNQLLQADLTYESRVVTKSLRTWLASLKKVQSNVVVARNAHSYFTQRTILRCWKAALEQKKRDAWVEDKRKANLKALFDRWMESTVQSVQDTQAVVKFQQDSDKRLTKSVLSQWTARVVAVKSLELDVIEKRDGLLLHNAFARWTTSSKRVNELKGLMHSFKDVKLEDSLRVVLRVWRNSAVQSRQRRIMLAKAEKERDAVLLKDVFDHWRSRYCGIQLAPIEQEVALRREDAVIFTAWDTWKARSKKLQAVTMDNKRVKKVAWSRWIRASALALQAKQAKATADRHLVEEIFATWKDAAKRKSSLRTTRIRGRIRQVSQTDATRTTPQARRSTNLRRDSHHEPTRPAPPRAGIPNSTIAHASQSVASEPAYSRLRSELSSRRRGASEEPEDGGVMRALRGALGDR